MSFGPSYNISVHFPDGININLPASSDRELAGLLKQILDQLQEQKQMATALQQDIDALTADVAAQKSVITSAITLLNGIGGIVADAVSKAEAAGASPEVMQTLTDLHSNITGNTAALASAVTANTPAVGTSAPPADTAATT